MPKTPFSWQSAVGSLDNPAAPAASATTTGNRSWGACHRNLRFSSLSLCGRSRSRSYHPCPTGPNWKLTVTTTCTYDAWIKASRSIYDYGASKHDTACIYDDLRGSRDYAIPPRYSDHSTITRTWPRSSDAASISPSHLRHAENVRRFSAVHSRQSIVYQCLSILSQSPAAKALVWVVFLRLGWVVVQPYGYTGRRYDSETDLWYFRARYFDSELGRFISRDPFSPAYKKWLNFYLGTFVPLSVDPFGEIDVPSVADAVESVLKSQKRRIWRVLAEGLAEDGVPSYAIADAKSQFDAGADRVISEIMKSTVVKDLTERAQIVVDKAVEEFKRQPKVLQYLELAAGAAAYAAYEWTGNKVLEHEFKGTAWKSKSDDLRFQWLAGFHYAGDPEGGDWDLSPELIRLSAGFEVDYKFTSTGSLSLKGKCNVPVYEGSGSYGVDLDFSLNATMEWSW